MKLYVFSCKTLTNIWAGIGAGIWAVSVADANVMEGRKTRAKEISRGSYGLIYCSDKNIQSFTTPFLIYSTPQPGKIISNVWPEDWTLPFKIKPLGTPDKTWDAYDAMAKLPFAKAHRNKNLSSVFKLMGTAVFSPIEVSDADIDMILKQLADL